MGYTFGRSENVAVLGSSEGDVMVKPSSSIENSNSAIAGASALLTFSDKRGNNYWIQSEGKFAEQQSERRTFYFTKSETEFISPCLKKRWQEDADSTSILQGPRPWESDLCAPPSSFWLQ